MGKIKYIILFVILFCMLFLLTGCDYGELKGVVIDKKYIAPYTTTIMMHMGKVMMPSVQYHPEHWQIQIQKEKERRNKDNLGNSFKRRI